MNTAPPATDETAAVAIYDVLRKREGMDHAAAVAWLRSVFPSADIGKALESRAELIAAASGQEGMAAAGCTVRKGTPTGSALLDARQTMLRAGMDPAAAKAYLETAVPGCALDDEVRRMKELTDAASTPAAAPAQ